MPPIDVDATVIANARLSSDYSVLSLAAPEVGARTQPGQFVMVKPAGVTDPLLRRPFSVFEVLRDAQGAITGVSILNKRAGRSTRRLYDLEAGDVVSCLGPLGQPFKPVSAPAKAWMVAGGVGLAPFATLAESLAASKTETTLFYGARTGEELFYLDFFERLGVTLVLTTENGARGTKGRVTLPLEAALKALGTGDTRHGLRVRPRADARGRGEAGGALQPAVAGLGRARHGLRPRRLLQLRRPGEARRRERQPRALVHQRPRVRRRGIGVGLMAAPIFRSPSARSRCPTR